MEQKMQHTSVMLAPEDIDFLSQAIYDFRKVSKRSVTKGAVIRAAIRHLASMDEGYRYAVIKVRGLDERQEG